MQISLDNTTLLVSELNSMDTHSIVMMFDILTLDKIFDEELNT